MSPDGPLVNPLRQFVVNTFDHDKNLEFSTVTYQGESDGQKIYGLIFRTENGKSVLWRLTEEDFFSVMKESGYKVWKENGIIYYEKNKGNNN